MKINSLFYQSLLIGLLITVIGLGGMWAGQVWAQTVASPTSTNSAIPEEQIEDNIRQRIQQAVERNQTTSTQQNIKAYVGTLDSITDQSLSLVMETVTEFIKINPETAIVDEDNESVLLENLAIDGGAVIIGYHDTNNIFQAIQIIDLEEVPQKTDKQLQLGTIIDINTRTRQIEILTQPNQETLLLTLLRSVQLRENLDEEEALTLTDLNETDQVLVIYTPDEEDNNLIRLHRTQIATTSAQTLE